MGDVENRFKFLQNVFGSGPFDCYNVVRVWSQCNFAIEKTLDSEQKSMVKSLTFVFNLGKKLSSPF